MNVLSQLFDTSDFPARWYCGNWSPELGWLHILSDLGVWSAYLAIPFVLGYFTARRRDLPFRRIFWLFGAFIFACGTTHLMEAIIFWHPVYRLAGFIKLATAIVSWATVVALIPIVPRALAMRSPEELEKEIAARKKAEKQLQSVNDELERRIQERTSALVKANADIKSDREWFRTTLASIGDAVITTDEEGRVSFMNGVARELTGWTGDEAQGRLLEEVFQTVDQETRKPVKNIIGRAMNQGSAIRSTGRPLLIAKNGAEWPIDENAAPIRDENGEVRGVVLVFREVSQRMRQEARLREKVREIATFMDVAPVALTVTYDRSCRTITGNREAIELLGVPLHSNISLSAPPEERPAFRVYQNGKEAQPEELPMQLAAATGTDVRDCELEIRFDDGRIRRIVSHASPLFDDSGNVRGCVGAILDVTEQKRAEASLREADQRKNEFLATLAHELRNPLAPIRNGLEVMRLVGGQGDTFIGLRDMMERQVRHLVRLVDDLLDVNRITRGDISLQKQRLRLATVVEIALETSRPIIDGFHHRFTLSLNDPDIQLEGDLTRLAQVVGNLLNNAAKYTPAGGNISLTVDRENGEAIIRVRDDGLGVPTEMRSKIFEMFTQVDRVQSRAKGGLGVGLTLVKRLVEMHGGTVEAFSEGAGQGSEFVVRLPCLPVQPLPGDMQPVGENGDASSTTLRVLVVDDNRDSAESLQMLVEAMGHECHAVFDGPSALEAAAGLHPDIILLDLGMPDMDGYEVARRLRQVAGLKDAIVVAQTGWGQEEHRRRSAEAGFDYHLVKPVDRDALQQLLVVAKGHAVQA